MYVCMYIYIHIYIHIYICIAGVAGDRSKGVDKVLMLSSWICLEKWVSRAAAVLLHRAADKRGLGLF